MINKRFQCLGRMKQTYTYVSNQTKPRKKDTQAFLCIDLLGTRYKNIYVRFAFYLVPFTSSKLDLNHVLLLTACFLNFP